MRQSKTSVVTSVFALAIGAGVVVLGCTALTPTPRDQRNAIKPVVVTEPVKWDTDDPAIWVNPVDRSQSLIIGTDKDADGALYVFDLNGKILPNRTVRGLRRPNNVDVEYGLLLGGKAIDIAVATEREANKIRVYRLPDMVAIDHGGIDVFTGEAAMEPMGISLYKRPNDGAVYAIVSRKSGPSEGYLWQYLLQDDGKGGVRGTKVRAFGLYSGKKEIESIAVDDQLGYVYYSDEQSGIRKYFADPDKVDAGKQLATISTHGYLEDNEGISIYAVNNGTGYILVSDQRANTFHIYTREGEPGNPHEHKEVKVVDVSTSNSDGSDVTNAPLDARCRGGCFVAMSDNKTYQFYSWADIAGTDLVIAPNGITQAK
jgi:3-phytase